MPPRKLRPSIEERALRSEQRMGLGSVSGRVESASPVRQGRGRTGRVPAGGISRRLAGLYCSGMSGIASNNTAAISFGTTTVDTGDVVSSYSLPATAFTPIVAGLYAVDAMLEWQCPSGGDGATTGALQLYLQMPADSGTYAGPIIDESPTADLDVGLGSMFMSCHSTLWCDSNHSVDQFQVFGYNKSNKTLNIATVYLWISRLA